MTRSERIAEKAKEFEGQLSQWCIENDILRPRERLVYSIRIETTPSLVVAAPEPVKMGPRDLSDVTALEVYETTLAIRERGTRQISRKMVAVELGVDPKLFLRKAKSDPDFGRAYYNGTQNYPFDRPML